MKTPEILKSLKDIIQVNLDDQTHENLRNLIRNIMEGTEVVTVGRYKQKCANFKSGGIKFSIPVWSIKTYIAKKNYKGQLKWFLKSYKGRTVASKEPSQKILNEAIEYGKLENLPYVPDVTQYSKVQLDQLL
jgi:hypothetical protein